jgi:hypothetical protein
MATFEGETTDTASSLSRSPEEDTEENLSSEEEDHEEFESVVEKSRKSKAKPSPQPTPAPPPPSEEGDPVSKRLNDLEDKLDGMAKGRKKKSAAKKGASKPRKGGGVNKAMLTKAAELAAELIIRSRGKSGGSAPKRKRAKK